MEKRTESKLHRFAAAVQAMNDSELDEAVRWFNAHMRERSSARARIASRKFERGQRVIWDYRDRLYHGTILNLNTKTASVRAEDGTKWRIAYSNLAAAI
jgi:hypothetical protein